MKLSTIILSVVLAVSVLLSAVSFFHLKNKQKAVNSIRRIDKEGLFYNRAKYYAKEKEADKAISAFTDLIEKYPASKYTESALRSLAALYQSKGDDTRAVYYYEEILSNFPDVKDASYLRDIITTLNRNMLQSEAMTADSIEYKVQPGDNLFNIAKKYNTTVELIKGMNDMSGDLIRVGQVLKINTAAFSIYVDKAENILILNKNGKPFKRYIVATGRNNSTPVGVFVIVDKMVKPVWTKPNGEVIRPDKKEYELGERWMPISRPGYGIHGTNDDSSIGGQTTSGCVRMYNQDVIELYNIVPKGTEVEIVDSRAIAKQTQDVQASEAEVVTE